MYLLEGSCKNPRLGETVFVATSFRARFLVVRRNELWLLANAFFWPIPIKPKPKPESVWAESKEPEYTLEAWDLRKTQITDALTSSEESEKAWALNELEAFSSSVEEAKEILKNI